jgi:hypothetical protein
MLRDRHSGVIAKDSRILIKKTGKVLRMIWNHAFRLFMVFLPVTRKLFGWQKKHPIVAMLFHMKKIWLNKKTVFSLK